MNKSRPRLIAIVTGIISISICVLYLLLITLFDSRAFLNEYLTNHSDNMGVVYYLKNSFYSS